YSSGDVWPPPLEDDRVSYFGGDGIAVVDDQPTLAVLDVGEAVRAPEHGIVRTAATKVAAATSAFGSTKALEPSDNKTIHRARAALVQNDPRFLRVWRC